MNGIFYDGGSLNLKGRDGGGRLKGRFWSRAARSFAPGTPGRTRNIRAHQDTLQNRPFSSHFGPKLWFRAALPFLFTVGTTGLAHCTYIPPPKESCGFEPGGAPPPGLRPQMTVLKSRAPAAEATAAAAVEALATTADVRDLGKQLQSVIASAVEKFDEKLHEGTQQLNQKIDALKCELDAQQLNQKIDQKIDAKLDERFGG